MNYDMGGVAAKAGLAVAGVLKGSCFGAPGEGLVTGELAAAVYRELAGVYWQEVLKDPSEERSFLLAVAEIEAARHSVSFGVSMLATRIVLEAVLSSGSGGWREELRKSAAGGGFAGALSVAAEGEGGLSATAGPDGTYVLDGVVKAAVNGPIASQALVCESRGGRAFIVDLRGGGVSVGGRSRTAGVPGLFMSEIVFKGARVGADRVIDGAKGAVSAALDLGLSNLCVGLSHRIFGEIKDHCGAAMLGGRPKTSDQHVRFKLAELMTQLQAAEFLVYRAVWMAAGKDPEAPVLAKVAKAFCSESVESIAANAALLAGSAALEYGGFFGLASADAQFLAISGTGIAEARTSVADSMIARYAD